jgi:cytochrome c-type biogenesis protein CcmH/NrfG
MNSEDLDKLPEEGLSGGPPRPEFREQTLRDSLTAFVRGRHSRARWRTAALSAAAVLIAGVSFLLGRSSLPREEIQTTVVATPVAAGDRTTAVPSELVTWLDAARFFKQLGMEERVARAYDRASKLLPSDTITACGATGQMFASGAGGDMERVRRHVSPVAKPGLRRPVENGNRVIAQSFGE